MLFRINQNKVCFSIANLTNIWYYMKGGNDMKIFIRNMFIEKNNFDETQM